MTVDYPLLKRKLTSILERGPTIDALRLIAHLHFGILFHFSADPFPACKRDERTPSAKPRSRLRAARQTSKERLHSAHAH